MSRYIDADALKESIDEHVYLVHHGFNETEYGITQYGIHQIIDETPTIDAEPVRHGKWIYTRYYTWECSECKKNPTSGMGYVQSKDELFDFCPNCGARMDKE